MALKAKHQRLTLILLAFAALLVATLLAAYALRGQASYFYAPSDLAIQHVEPGRAIRLGGMVRPGSLRQAVDGVTVNFVVEDGKASVPVRYRGITPDLFTEGSGVVAEGRMTQAGTFVADNLLAKHDENYMPREIKDMNLDQIKHMADTTTVGK